MWSYSCFERNNDSRESRNLAILKLFFKWTAQWEIVMGSGHHFWARAQAGMGFVGTGRHGQCHFINFWAWAPTIGHRALKGHE